MAGINGPWSNRLVPKDTPVGSDTLALINSVSPFESVGSTIDEVLNNNATGYVFLKEETNITANGLKIAFSTPIDMTAVEAVLIRVITSNSQATDMSLTINSIVSSVYDSSGQYITSGPTTTALFVNDSSAGIFLSPSAISGGNDIVTIECTIKREPLGNDHPLLLCQTTSETNGSYTGGGSADLDASSISDFEIRFANPQVINTSSIIQVWVLKK